MALTAAGALVRAQYRAAWNRILRSAGFGGTVATWFSFAVVALVLAFPGLLMTRIGLDLGYELAISGDAAVLRSWNGLMAVFTLGFALLGGLRAKPSFPASRFGRYPVASVELLVAELPAALFEVFPLLATGGILALHLGLAVRMPWQAPLIGVLAFVAVATMLATMLVASALYAWLGRRRMLLLALVASVGALAVKGGADGLRRFVGSTLPSIPGRLPVAKGYEGLIALRAGRGAEAAAALAISLLAALLLIAAAALVQRRRMAAEAEPRRDPLRFFTAVPLDSRSTAPTSLVLIQLLTNRVAIALLLIPLLYSAPLALVASLGRSAVRDGRELVEPIGTFMRLVESAPIFALLPMLSIAMNAQIWLNQFGWDRRGIRTLLLLPMEPRALLLARLNALAAFTAIQSVIAALPLLAVRPPRLMETAVGLAAAGVALLVTTGAGHVVSILHPRGVEEGSSAQIPLHLSWIAPVTLFGTVAELAGVWFLFDSIAAGGGVVGLALSLVAAVAAYRALLPRVSTLLVNERERLLTM